MGDPDYPTPRYFVSDSIRMNNFAPGGSLDIADYGRTVNETMYGLPQTYICIVDRPDEVNELDETNNYEILRGVNW